MAVNSRAKGKRGELDFRDFLRQKFGDTEAQRGQQRKGSEESPDVESPLLRRLKIHPEVKFAKDMRLTHRTTLMHWMTQARNDAGSSLTPVVFHRWNRSDWWAIMENECGTLCIMLAEDYIKEKIGQ